MTVTESDLMHAAEASSLLDLIDAALKTYGGGRSLVDAEEVCDLLLDLRQQAMRLI